METMLCSSCKPYETSIFGFNTSICLHKKLSTKDGKEKRQQGQNRFVCSISDI